MSEKKEKSIGVKALASVSSLTLIVCVVILLVAGTNLFTGLVAVAAFGGLTAPAVMTGDTLAECVSGVFEMFMEGISTIFEAIASIFSSF
ncbi:hypothetical protein EDC56_3705 [Sinobacterium caligoides]|uniref:Uncharacterized protein n=1 Tax=Sinobacterium caligoides TaxID=933926 RepID=A0A3N2D5C7_9GAMM|nr:hypothetical protein [Sinobacterium caligoides]ROR94892.1 hypothetical protein EDC56_3705 [Sinobacterium caligoides]